MLTSRYKCELNFFGFFHPPIDHVLLPFGTQGSGFASNIFLALTDPHELVVRSAPLTTNALVKWQCGLEG